MSVAKVAKSGVRGSKPGERRGGRVRGTPNKATADVKKLAGKYTAAAMKELGRLSVEAESEAARVAAIKELFDRAYGKASQTVAVDAGGLTVQIVRFGKKTPSADDPDSQ